MSFPTLLSYYISFCLSIVRVCVSRCLRPSVCMYVCSISFVTVIFVRCICVSLALSLSLATPVTSPNLCLSVRFYSLSAHVPITLSPTFPSLCLSLSPSISIPVSPPPPPNILSSPSLPQPTAHQSRLSAGSSRRIRQSDKCAQIINGTRFVSPSDR